MELQKMDNKLASITINEQLVKQLYHFNYLTSYPINDSTLEGWARSIEELEPIITPDVIRWICDNMKIGKIDYDNRKGIQNIFNGFRKWINYQQSINPTDELSLLYRKYKLNSEDINSLKR